ncbi:MAG TPA: NAD(P)H-binding protein [Sphingomicrobium sp.]|nr:NAD(P)H-binding protein [Sphingomicrobium sp.]
MIGATGLIGGKLAPVLVARGHKLLILGRRPAGVDGAEEVVGEMATWPAELEGRDIDVAISTLGTTWRKAGSWPAFAAVDRDGVVRFAEAARASGARQMIMVSSSGANPQSRNRYLALKGRVERDLADLGFERLDLVRPGLLRGERGADRRLGERIGIAISPLSNLVLRGPLDRFAAIEADVVAAAMATLAGQAEPGRLVHHNREIRRLAVTRGDAHAPLG